MPIVFAAEIRARQKFRPPPIAAAQLPRLDASLRAANVTLEPIILPPGEQTKSWRHLEQLLDALLALEIERGDHVVALGGGALVPLPA